MPLGRFVCDGRQKWYKCLEALLFAVKVVPQASLVFSLFGLLYESPGVWHNESYRNVYPVKMNVQCMLDMKDYTLIRQLSIVRCHGHFLQSPEIGLPHCNNLHQKIKGLYSSTPLSEQIGKVKYAALRMDKVIDLPPQSPETVERGSPCCSGNSGGRERWVARGVFNNNLVPIQSNSETIFFPEIWGCQDARKMFFVFSFCLQFRWTDRKEHRTGTPVIIICSQTCCTSLLNIKEKLFKFGKILERGVIVAQGGLRVHFWIDL